MTTDTAAATLADIVLGQGHPEHDRMVAWLAANRQSLVSDVASGATDADTAARALIREFRVYMRAVPGALHDLVRRATPPRKAA